MKIQSGNDFNQNSKETETGAKFTMGFICIFYHWIIETNTFLIHTPVTVSPSSNPFDILLPEKFFYHCPAQKPLIIPTVYKLKFRFSS